MIYVAISFYNCKANYICFDSVLYDLGHVVLFHLIRINIDKLYT